MKTKQLKYNLVLKKMSNLESFFIVFSKEQKKGYVKISNTFFKTNKGFGNLQNKLLSTSTYITCNMNEKDKVILLIKKGQCFHANQIDLANTDKIFYSINKNFCLYYRFFFLLKLSSMEK